MDSNSKSLLSSILIDSQSLTSISLKNNYYTINDGIEILSKVIANNPNIKEIKLINYVVSTDDAIMLARAIAANQNIRSLMFDTSSITEVGLCELANIIKLNNCLEKLRFIRVDLSGYNLKIILGHLRETIGLRNLTMIECNINDDYAKEFAELLIANKYLQTLNLLRNSVSDLTSKYLAIILPYLKNLKYLELSYNNISKDGCINILNALRENTSIEFFDLDCNIPSLDKTYLKAIKQNCSLISMGVSNLKKKNQEKVFKQTKLNKYGPRNWYNSVFFVLVCLNNIYSHENWFSVLPLELFNEVMLMLKVPLIKESSALDHHAKYESKTIHPFRDTDTDIDAYEWLKKINAVKL